MLIDIQKIHPAAIIPEYATPGDSGADLYAIERTVIEPGDVAGVRTGIKLRVPEGYEAQVRPKSGLALKHKLTVMNTPGTIDSGFRGEILVILINHGRTAYTIEAGTKIAQLVLCAVERAEFVEVAEISAQETERGAGGFGSTGTQARMTSAQKNTLPNVKEMGGVVSRDAPRIRGRLTEAYQPAPTKSPEYAPASANVIEGLNAEIQSINTW